MVGVKRSLKLLRTWNRRALFKTYPSKQRKILDIFKEYIQTQNKIKATKRTSSYVELRMPVPKQQQETGKLQKVKVWSEHRRRSDVGEGERMYRHRIVLIQTQKPHKSAH